jgi:hypothetical protein
MPFKHIDPAKVPAYDIVEARVRANGEVSILETGYDFDNFTYRRDLVSLDYHDLCQYGLVFG